MKPVPVEIRHDWRKTKINNPSGGTSQVHVCSYCKMWTAAPRMHANAVCPAKDRRKSKTDRRDSNRPEWKDRPFENRRPIVGPRRRLDAITTTGGKVTVET